MKRHARHSSSNNPVRDGLTILIVGLFGAALLIGAVWVWLNAQRTVSSASMRPRAPNATAAALSSRPHFVPPEEAGGVPFTTPERPRAQASPTAGSQRPPVALDRLTKILLLGSDRRAGDAVWRTDVIMLVFLDAPNGRAAVLSLPRDLYVQIPTRGWDRINIADFWGEYTKYPGGGPALLARVIEEGFGVRVDHWVRVDFEGFTRIVDALGGIDVDVPCPLEEDFIDPTSPTGFRKLKVEVGMQHMDGETALMYVRQRHGSGDIRRAQRQQHVAYALRAKILSPEVIPQIPQLYMQLQNAVQTDFSPLDLPNLLQAGLSIRPENIRGRVIDATMSQSWTTPDGKSVLLFDRDKVRAAIDDLFNAPVLEETESVCE